MKLLVIGEENNNENKLFFNTLREPLILELNAFPGVVGPQELGINPYLIEIEKLNS